MCRLLIVSILFSGDLAAQKNDFAKSQTFLSITAGYASSHVFGTMPQKDLQYDAPLGGKLHMENGSGFTFGIIAQRNLSDYFYLRSGLQYIQRQVDPEEKTIVFYKDSLKTGYLSLPILFGINVWPQGHPVNLSFEFGPVANFRLSDRTKIGPDRVAFKTSFASLSLCPGATLSFSSTSGQMLLLHYSYMFDITNAYVEYLYWNSSDPRRPFTYKYGTSIFSFAYQWTIR
jgi:hypothetical protein